MKLRAAAIMVLIMAGVTGEARAQVVWDSPLLLPPRPEAGTGIYLIDAHRAGIGVLGTWRQSPQGMGMRLGIAEGGAGSDVAVFGGVDLTGLVATVGADLPFDLAWLAGIGAGYDEWLVISAPVGLTLGRTFSTPEIRFTPHLAPRLALDLHLDRDEPDNGNALDLNFGVDLGLDLAFQPGWTIRLGASLGHRTGVGVGLLF